MNRLILLFTWLALATSANLRAGDEAAPLNHAATTDKPNIIFILADDLSYWDLSCFGQKCFATPNIDRLANEGRIFANAYAGGSWCAPSRTSLMTGRNSAHFAPPSKDRFNPTVAEMLKTAGYNTAVLGKWHMLETPKAEWLIKMTWAEQKAATDWKQMPWHRGFDVCRIGFRCGFFESNGNPYFPWQIETGDKEEIAFPENHDLDVDQLWQCAKDHYDAQGRFLDMKGKNSSQMRYAEDYYRDEAVKFIRENKSQPFFLYYATPLVHSPLVVDQIGQFKDTKGWTLKHKVYASMVQELDRSVGIITDEVKKLGLDKKTLIFFASDNGYAFYAYFGRHHYEDDPVFHNKGPWNRGKFVTTDGGVTIPFIAWGPGRVPVGKTDRAIIFYDFMATAAELSGGSLPGPTDGVSYVRLLEGRDADQPLRAIMEWPPEFPKVKRKIGITGMITDDWSPTDKDKEQTYTPDALLLDEKWYALRLGNSIRICDISTDPGMKHDAAADHPDLLMRAKAEFAKFDLAK
jgi:hypothetical protein